MANDIVNQGADEHQQVAEMLVINEKLVIAGVRLQELAETAHRSEERLRHLVYGLDAVICEVDTRNGQPSFLSLRAETFLGHPLGRWHDQSNFLAEIIHPSDRERITALFPLLVHEEQDYEYEFRALSDDADWIWMRNIVRVVQNAEGNAELLRCVIVDVTAQRQAAQLLEKSYARERHIAETLQRSMLFMPPEDSFPGLAVKTLYHAASDEAHVGGDFWDTLACDHGNVALVLGDVMGHGLPAAIYTAELKFALRGFVREHEQPARILTQMNSYLCESHRLYREGLNDEGDDAPVCLIVAIINTNTGQGAVASAGMEPALLIRSDGQMEEMQVNGLLLGIEQNEGYKEGTFQLEPGDMILLVTDGVTEARRDRTLLGYEGLVRLAEESRSLGTLEKIGQSIIDGAQSFAGGNLRDDASVLLARRL